MSFGTVCCPKRGSLDLNDYRQTQMAVVAYTPVSEKTPTATEAGCTGDGVTKKAAQ